jgi:hypothetical protein
LVEPNCMVKYPPNVLYVSFLKSFNKDLVDDS